LLLLVGINLAPTEFSGAIGARAEEVSDDAAKMQQWEQVQQSPGDEDDTGMMGHGVARHCMLQCMAESDKDQEEMLDFMRGTAKSQPQQ
jgi:hypothetical protein